MWGTFYVLIPYAKYYDTLDNLRKLFEMQSDFVNSVQGYYVNHIQDLVNGIKDSVRISYFVQSEKKQIPLLFLQKYLAENQLKELDKRDSPTIKDKNNFLVLNYGGLGQCADTLNSLEIRFRNYLHVETQVGLDLLYSDKRDTIMDEIERARVIRTNIYARDFPRNEYALTISEILTPIFKNYSKTYRDLTQVEKSHFFFDLNYSPNKFPNPDWIHFFFNLTLGKD